VQVFEEDDLVVNVTRHHLAPKYRPLTPEETKEFLQSKGLSLSQLPRVLWRDPVVQYFGMERGSVLAIERESDTAGAYAMYRQVI
jgi:DNA-directed RNA polymerase I, II, and III subunit RPABC1